MKKEIDVSGIDLAQMRKAAEGTMATALGMEFTEIGADYLCAKMPVNENTIQPMGLLHGGASVALAETLGSFGSFLLIDREKQASVGLEINANHIRSAKKGTWVFGRASALHLGRRTHVWEIRITDEDDRLVCVSRLTVAVIDR